LEKILAYNPKKKCSESSSSAKTRGTYISIGVYRKNMDHYLDDVLEALNHQDSGIKAVRFDLKIFMSYLEVNKIRQITMDSIMEFIPYLSTVRDNNPDSINRKLSSVKTYLRYLGGKVGRGTAILPLDHMRRVLNGYSGPLKALRPSEVLSIFEKIDRGTILGVRDYLFFNLLYRLGLRIGEAISIDMCDINLEEQTILIHGKGRRERTLPLIGNMPSLLQDWMYLRKEMKNGDQENALFISKKGFRLSQRRAQEKFKDLRLEVGKLSLSKVTPHSLRHAFATHWMESDLDFRVLQAMMGHAKRESTERYLHPSVETQRNAVKNHLGNELLGKFILNNKHLSFQGKNHHRQQQALLDQKVSG
jgi:integrase/recombinase XerD